MVFAFVIVVKSYYIIGRLLGKHLSLYSFAMIFDTFAFTLKANYIHYVGMQSCLEKNAYLHALYYYIMLNAMSFKEKNKTNETADAANLNLEYIAS